MLDNRILILKEMETLLFETEYSFGEILYYTLWNSRTGLDMTGQGRLPEVPDENYYKILHTVLKEWRNEIEIEEPFK